MKKSTIFLVLMVYLVSFFVVGFLGIAVQSAYSMTYVQEILITALPDQPALEFVEDEKIKNEAIDEEHVTYTHNYTYKFKYIKGTTLKFSVDIMPLESTYRDFELINMLKSDNLEVQPVTYDVVDGNVVCVTYSKRRAAEFKIQSTDGNKTESTVKIIAYL